MESKKEKSHLTRNEKRRRKRSGRDPNPEVEGHTADVQDREAGNGQEVEGGLTAEEGVHTIGDHLGGGHLLHIIGSPTLF